MAMAIIWNPSYTTGACMKKAERQLSTAEKQEQPLERSWRLWRKACNLFTGKAGRLHHPLGKWEHPIADLCRRWPCLYSPSTTHFYHWNSTSNTYDTDEHISYDWDDCPADCHPCNPAKPGKGNHRLSQFCGSDLATMQLSLGTDSESLLTRVNKEGQQLVLHPNDTLVADWDVTHEIQHHLRTLSFWIELVHVRGHQDKTILYKDLPLMAQLNVDADVLASQYMVSHPFTTSNVPRLTHNLCQLELSQGSINGRYPNTLRHAALQGDLWDHLKARNDWTESTIVSTNWKAFEQAYARGPFFKHRVTLVKHFNGISPTGKIAHRNDSSHPAGCPSCDCPVKEEDHVVLCPSPSRRQWRSSFISGLQQLLDKPTMDSQLALSHILRHGTMLWFRHEFYDPNTVSPRYCRLVHEQNAIGWNQLFHGRLTKEWQRHQDCHLRSKKTPTPKRVAFNGLGR
jgi:hypothetical protein